MYQRTENTSMIYEFVPGDLHELFVAVLLVDGGELGLGGRDQERGQDLHRGQQLINVVPGHDHVTVFDVSNYVQNGGERFSNGFGLIRASINRRHSSLQN